MKKIIFCVILSALIGGAYIHAKKTSESGSKETSEFPKVKYKEPKFGSWASFTTPTQYGYYSKNDVFKDDEGFPFNIGVLFTRDFSNDNITFYISTIYRGKDNGKVPKGDAILIRTGSGNVYEGKTVKEITSELISYEEYISNGNFLKKMEFTDMEAQYKLPLEAAADIAENGITKIRINSSTPNPKDYNFTGKKFEKISNKIGNLTKYCHHMVTSPNVYKLHLERRQKAKEKKEKQESIPEF